MAATSSNILAGFICNGIWLFKRDIFSECDFAPTTITDRPLDNEALTTENKMPGFQHNLIVSNYDINIFASFCIV